MLAILNTAMTFGILVGVWVGVCKTDGELKEAVFAINRYFREKIKDITNGDD